MEFSGASMFYHIFEIEIIDSAARHDDDPVVRLFNELRNLTHTFRSGRHSAGSENPVKSHFNDCLKCFLLIEDLIEGTVKSKIHPFCMLDYFPGKIFVYFTFRSEKSDDYALNFQFLTKLYGMFHFFDFGGMVHKISCSGTNQYMDRNIEVFSGGNKRTGTWSS